MPRRVPDLGKIRALVGYEPKVHLDEILDGVTRTSLPTKRGSDRRFVGSVLSIQGERHASTDAPPYACGLPPHPLVAE
jgi:hypothetical protein